MVDQPRKSPAMEWTNVLNSWRRRLMNQKYISPLLGVLATGGIMAFRGTGAFQVWELHTFDWMMSHRIAEQPDNRVVIIGIDEQDIMQYGKAVVSDEMLADVIEAIKKQNPTVIGMDFFS